MRGRVPRRHWELCIRPGYAAYLRCAITYPFTLIARGLQDRNPALSDAMASGVVTWEGCADTRPKIRKEDCVMHPPRGQGRAHAACENQGAFIFQYAKVDKIDLRAPNR
jgi:hypothetical protein